MAIDWNALDSLVQRLVENPQDEGALRHAYEQGESDPEGYAGFLEKVGLASADSAYAAHWLTESATVWAETLADAHRAARLLMTAVERDPTHRGAGERLADLYRQKGDAKALLALLERRGTAVATLAATDPAHAEQAAGIFEEMGRLWADSLQQPARAVDAFRRALEFDPNSAYAVFSVRELLKGLGRLAEALPYYAMEFEVEADPARRALLLRDELDVRRAMGDLDGTTPVLAKLRALDPEDPVVQQEYAASILDRAQGGKAVSDPERSEAASILISLAEAYGGEHGVAYAGAALDLMPGDDRAMGLFAAAVEAMGQQAELVARFPKYLAQNPNGAFAEKARAAGAAAEPVPSAPSRVEPRPSAPPAEATEAPPAVEAATEGAPTDAPPALIGAELAASTPVSDAPSSDEKTAKAGVEHVSPPQAAPANAAPLPKEPRRWSDAPPPPAGSKRGSIPLDQLQGILDDANSRAQKGEREEAFTLYRHVLDSEPNHSEALGWVEDYLRTKRDYPALRDVLLASVRTVGSTDTLDTRKARLREIAGLCEAHLRDLDGAIYAWRQVLSLDRTDDGARNTLTRLLERGQRWDDVANILEQEATVEGDIETKIGLEKKLARLHEDKRKDLGSAGESWARIANLTPEDDVPVETATTLFERAELLDRAVEFLADHYETLEDIEARDALEHRLARLEERAGSLAAAARTWQKIATKTSDSAHWAEVERLADAAGLPAMAAASAHKIAEAVEGKEKAAHLFRAAKYLGQANQEDAAITTLEGAVALDRQNDGYADALLARYENAGHEDRIVSFLEARAEVLESAVARVAARRRAAQMAAVQGDLKTSERLYEAVLADGPDEEALARLAAAAVRDSRWESAADLLRKQEAVTVGAPEKAALALKEAKLREEHLNDPKAAAARYEDVVATMDPKNRQAFEALATLREASGDLAGAALALASNLELATAPEDRRSIALRLGGHYETLSEKEKAIAAFDHALAVAPDDFALLGRQAELLESTGNYSRTVDALATLADAELDEDAAATLTIKRSAMLAEKLSRADDGLAGLEVLADGGHRAVRDAYVALGDAHGRGRLVAEKLRSWWFNAPQSDERTEALRGSFNRYRAANALAEGLVVGLELSKAEPSAAVLVESMAVEANDVDALHAAQATLVRGLTGLEKATELVRQAEVLSDAKQPLEEALMHGEQGLAGLSLDDAEPLLVRLASLAGAGAPTVDLYERHVTRAKSPEAKFATLVRAAQVAASSGETDRAKNFLEIAISGNPTPSGLDDLESAASAGDEASEGTILRQALITAFAAGGTGARDGGRTRAAMLRRAASLSERALGDIPQAHHHLQASLVAHVEAETLTALDELGARTGDWPAVEAVYEAALSEVFDGPLVRQLLTHRSNLRRNVTSDKAGAAADLRRLHDLAPHDQPTLDALSALLEELGDHRGRVQLLEDQILRQKDLEIRTDLARQVARMWDGELADPREAADAWRRVLRMKAQDPEATTGLERAKATLVGRGASTGASFPPPSGGASATSIVPPRSVREEPVRTVLVASKPESVGPAMPVEPAPAPQPPTPPAAPEPPPAPPVAPTPPEPPRRSSFPGPVMNANPDELLDLPDTAVGEGPAPYAQAVPAAPASEELMDVDDAEMLDAEELDDVEMLDEDSE